MEYRICPKCQHLMIWQKTEAQFFRYWIYQWVCPKCGRREDDTIVNNRGTQRIDEPLPEGRIMVRKGNMKYGK